MQRPSDLEKLEFWRKHLSVIHNYGGSARAYCLEHGLAYHNLAYWKKRVQTKRTIKIVAKKENSFIPVLMAPVQAERKQIPLPNAKWLGEVLFELQARFL